MRAGRLVAGYLSLGNSGDHFPKKGQVVIRASCFAAGMFVSLWGLAFMAIDKVVLHQPTEKDPGIRGMLAKQVVDKEQRPIIDPPDWAAFTLLSIGSVSMLYAVALPKNA